MRYRPRQRRRPAAHRLLVLLRGGQQSRCDLAVMRSIVIGGCRCVVDVVRGTSFVVVATAAAAAAIVVFAISILVVDVVMDVLVRSNSSSSGSSCRG